MSSDVIIIGGGLSGLAAAVELAFQGAHVSLFEQSPKLGGRCYSYIDSTTGDIVDNGQHLLIGAYRNTLRYLEIIGSQHLLWKNPYLYFYHPERGFAKFNVASLSNIMSLLKFKLLSLCEWHKMLIVGFELRRWDSCLEKELSNLTVQQWLTQKKQSDNAQRSFWNPIAIAVMNELPDKASALLFARCLKAAFFGEKKEASILIPAVGQTELYISGAIEFLKKYKGMIYTNTKVENIDVEKSKVKGVRFKDGSRCTARYVISAVPYYSLKNVIPSSLKTVQPFLFLNKFDSSPIVSINLWFDREFMKMEYVGVIGKQLQWIFNRREILKGEKKQGSYISAVISGARDVVAMSKEELVCIAKKDLEDVFPESKQCKLVHSIVIKEKRATLSATNDIELLRPMTQTPLENFYLAGDWTNTGLPATIEGAIKSGFSAAHCIQ